MAIVLPESVNWCDLTLICIPFFVVVMWLFGSHGPLGLCGMLCSCLHICLWRFCASGLSGDWCMLYVCLSQWDSVRLIDGMTCLMYCLGVICVSFLIFFAWSNATCESVMSMYG